MGSRIKTTDAPVVFTARGEVLLNFGAGEIRRKKEYKTSDRSELARNELTSKKNPVGITGLKPLY